MFDEVGEGPRLFSDAQLDGTACIGCGTADGPLHRGETITTRAMPGVVQDTTVVRCTPCVKARHSARVREGS
ncbi:hypothetical protein P3T36_005347 [Kitasatospora sp. MAP12-15]|uniref:hypothetical protein n=1 Tax=unclassified Kitasatospora TaxID=2633591 RepID=UPI002476BEE8|nr:hypothetical protein [Kitasatospora sp. MAP12-44]MDH6109852.1 hypothetical protein [Kitasatospora sp. MAP12-44]